VALKAISVRPGRRVLTVSRDLRDLRASQARKAIKAPKVTSALVGPALRGRSGQQAPRALPDPKATSALAARVRRVLLAPRATWARKATSVLAGLDHMGLPDHKVTRVPKVMSVHRVPRVLAALALRET
jgi:hypothetical protein